MSLLVQLTQERASSPSKTTLFESKKSLNWNTKTNEKEAMELQASPLKSEYRKGFEVRR